MDGSPRHLFFVAAFLIFLRGLLMAGGALESELRLGWESQLVEEGRRALEAPGGVATAALAVSGRSWFLESSHAFNSHADYWQAQLTLGLTHETDGFALEGGYTLVKLWSEGEEFRPDHEAFLRLTLPLGERTELILDGLFGYRSRGLYTECTLRHELAGNARTTWSVHATMAGDFGYASPEFDGPSHGLLGTEISHPLFDHWTLTLFLNAILPFEDVRRDGGARLLYGGFSLGGRF
jgi:hypothetical protein